jgi:GH25 family lysozyme M1 (1,4-beta-N-acetylmuramidase)
MAFIEGPDVSKWQGQINFQKMKERGARFVIIRAGYGGSVGIAHDERVDENVAGAKAAGLPYGLYWYFHPARDPKAQAGYLIAKLRQHSPFAIPPVIDIEEPPSSGAGALVASVEEEEGAYTMGSQFAPPTDEALQAANLAEPAGGISQEWHQLGANAKIFLDEVRAALAELEVFHQPLIYTNWSFWNALGRPVWGEEFALWLAAWTTAPNPVLPSPWRFFTFWQYTNSAPGVEYGVSSQRLDMNRFYSQDLDAYLIPPMPPKPDLRRIVVALIAPDVTREQYRQIANIRWTDKAILTTNLIDAQTLMDSGVREDSQLLVYGYGRFTPAEREIIRQYNWSQRAMPV